MKSQGAGRFPTGLDLGSTAIKWIQLGLVNGQLQVVEMGHQLRVSETAPEADRQAELQGLLRALVKPRRLGRAVVLSLPLEEVSLRVLKLPVLPAEELSQAIRWQIEQTLPAEVSYDEFIVDHAVLQDIAGQWESKVLVASVSRQRIGKLVEQVRGAGLQPVAIEIDPFALAACAAWRDSAPAQQTVLLLHLGARTASFSVMAKGQLAFSRSLLATGQSLTHTIADHLHVSVEQAENLKRTLGLQSSQDLAPGAPLPEANDQATAVARALASPLESLLVDILHAFKSFSHQVAQSQIQRFDRMILAGGGAKLPGLAPWLQKRLGAPVELVNPFEAVPMASPLAAEPWQAHAPDLALAMGLALRDAPGARHATKRMNVLPKEFHAPPARRLAWTGWQPPRLALSARSVAAVAALAGLAVIVGWPGVVAWRYRSGTQHLRRQLVQLRKMSAQLNTQQQALHVQRADYEAKRARLADRRRALLGVRQSESALSEVLRELAQAVPADVWLVNVRASGGLLHVEGETREPAAVVRLMDALERSGHFRNTTFSSTQRSSREASSTVYAFDISTTPIRSVEGAS